MKYDVTFPYTRRPYYSVTGIIADSRQEAVDIARKQAAQEIVEPPTAQPQVKEYP